MRAITISRQYGSGGQQIATQVCEAMGFRYFDKQVIAQVASEVGLSEHNLVDFSEQHLKENRFLDQFMQVVFGARAMMISSQPQTWGGLEAHLDEDWWVQLVNRAICTAYHEGNVVIVGRGAQIVLRDKPDVLHVRIQAPMESRIHRIQKAEDLSRIQALELAEAYDRASSRYLDRYLKTPWDSPMHYHLVINTGKTALDQAVSLIVEAAQQLDRIPA